MAGAHRLAGRPQYSALVSKCFEYQDLSYSSFRAKRLTVGQVNDMITRSRSLSR